MRDELTLLEERQLGREEYDRFSRLIKAKAKSIQDIAAIVKKQPLVEIKKGNLLRKQLLNSDFFDALSNGFAKSGKFEEAKMIFLSMFETGEDGSTVHNDYGACLMNEMISKNQINYNQLIEAKKHTFNAMQFDIPTKGHLYEGALFPAFINLCLMRNVEARLYQEAGSFFVSFILGWMSIEMSLYRLWCNFLKSKYASKKKRQSLAILGTKQILEILFMTNFYPELTKLKDNLDTLKGRRDKLLHGIGEDPSDGEVETCLEIGYKLIQIGQ